jgi:radical SAM protein with 4Fe4S-binding SPASM domain
MNEVPEVHENKEVKIVRSPGYNLFYQKSNQQGVRCGRTKEEDPDFSPFGPESVTIDTSCPLPGGGYQHLKPQIFKEVIRAIENPCLCWVTIISEGRTNPNIKSFIETLVEKGITPRVLVERSRVSDLQYLEDLCGISELDQEEKIGCRECEAMLFSMHIGVTGDIYPCQSSISKVRRGPSIFDGGMNELWYSDMAKSFRKARLETPPPRCPIYPDGCDTIDS